VSVSEPALQLDEIPATVRQVFAAQPVVDMHTHLYPPAFGPMMLWGIDELLTYHYLVAEVYRVMPATKLPYEKFWAMSKRQQADHIWKHLFVERTPISEACRGVLTTLQKLNLDVPGDSLERVRKWFDGQDANRFIDRVMELSGVSKITMTNAVFDDDERNRWLVDKNVGSDPRFSAVVRIDPILRDWPTAARKLSEWGYRASPEIDRATVQEVRRFLREWRERMKAIYVAVSLPPEWRYPAQGGPVERAGQTMLEEVVLPVCEEQGLPFAMMIGSRLRVNPDLREAGDMVGKADIASVVNLCARFPRNKFFVTMLSRENQHELAVAARKFGNLMVFGCWWFVNNPSLIDEITRMRVELLGTSFIPQHSDARILDQLVYKWDHSRKLIANVLADKYIDLATTGWPVTRPQIERDARLLLRDNFM
jgi:hypothetical protein